MTPKVNVALIRTTVSEIVGEANWLIGELTSLEEDQLDDGQGPTIRKLCQTLAATAQYDVQSEIDSLEERINGSGEDSRTPAHVIRKWLREDIEPLARLAQARMQDGQASSLALLLMTGSGEIVQRFLTVDGELKKLAS